MNLDKFSTENLEKIQKVLKIILETIELQGLNRLTGNKISLEKFKQIGLYFDDVVSVVHIINQNNDIGIMNDYYKEQLDNRFGGPYTITLETEEEYLRRFFSISKRELEEYLILKIENIEYLKTVKKQVEAKCLSLKNKKQSKEKTEMPTIFEVKIRDRYIWINNYLLSKPHATGSNLEFFEYVQKQPPNTKIERNKLPNFGDLSLKQEVKNKSFIKILTELGFKGELLKAFFPKRGQDMLIYRGDKITKKDLEKTGVKMSLFIKELELAHLKSSPE